MNAHRIVRAAASLVVLALVTIACDGRTSSSPTSAAPEATGSGTSAGTASVRPTPAARISVGGFPADLKVGFGAVWAGSEQIDALDRIDPQTMEVTVIPLGAGFRPQRIDIADGSVWVAGERGIERIDPQTDRAIVTIDGSYWSVTHGFSSVWFAGDSRVTRVDPTTNRIVEKIPLRGCRVSVGAGSLWASCGRTVYRIDPDRGRIEATIHHPGIVLASGGNLWLASGRDIFSVADPAHARTDLDQLDPSTSQIIAHTTVHVAHGTSAYIPLVDGDTIWLMCSNGVGPDVGMLFEFDARAGHIVNTFDLSEGKGMGANSVAFGFGSAWTANGPANLIRRWLLQV